MAAGILVWSGTVFASTMLSKDVSTSFKYLIPQRYYNHQTVNSYTLIMYFLTESIDNNQFFILLVFFFGS